MPRTVALAGASGLVGSSCLRLLLDAPDYARVLSLGRRALPLSQPKLRQLEVDFSALPPADEPLDTAFCALGTTRKKAGSDAAFRRVDLDYVVAFARWARAAGAATFVLVSSVGAQAGAGNLYLRTKGEAEAEVAALGFRSVTFLRPSFLLGARDEERPFERAAIGVARVLAPLCLGPLARYRPIAAADVARAMLAADRASAGGSAVWHYDRLVAARAS